jgi:hypothetical protein
VGTAELPAAQITFDALDCGRIRSIARKHPTAHRQPLAGNRQCHHDLGRPRPVLGPPEAAQLILVVFVDGEGAGGGVIEEEIHLELEEVCGVEEHRLLDLGGLGVKRVHRRVEVVLGQLLGPRQVDRLAPALPDPQLRLGIA